eukprot:gnl/TRDRNA2_/TRDRNA2_129337_c2_seq4.p1 gnl/TRDRNA2_/TRDRNA2_129337_c2~~gnl/TRDRNA2_/TRDRNA2_129337_c2_seq4.p1  ORF type:complete len:127 (-),score=13.45 gnl/TRDRNA2_/TRDRNA2_129337_c2_seq4:36-416(-)
MMLRMFSQFVPPPDDISQYVKRESVRCITPASLLKELGVSPRAVDHLIIDAEGYDSVIANMFLRLEGFAPNEMQIEVGEDEHVGDFGPVRELMRDLASRGYNLHRSEGDLLALKAFAHHKCHSAGD